VQRLQSRPQFQAVLAGQTVARTPHFAWHRLPLPSQESHLLALFAADDTWLGAMVPKRWARRAVTRNAVRRQVYALGHDLRAAFPQGAHLVRLRSGFDRQLFPSASSVALKTAVRAELKQLFGQVGVTC